MANSLLIAVFFYDMFRSLRARIMLGFVILVLLVTFVAVWTVVHTSTISDRTLAIEQRDFAHLRSVNQMRTAIGRYSIDLLRFIGHPSDSIRTAIAKHQEEFHFWLDEVRADDMDEEDRRHLDSIAGTFLAMNVRFTKLAELLSARRDTGSRAEQGMLFYTTEILPIYDSLAILLRNQREIDHTRILRRIQDVHSTALFISYSTAVIAMVVLVLGLILSQRVLRIILDPIRQLTLNARRVAEGDFDHVVPESSQNDEMSTLVRHFNVMVKRLQEYDTIKIGELMAEKRRCEIMIKDLSDVIIATDQNGCIIYFNREAEDVTGISARLVIGHRLADVAADHPLMRRIQEDSAPGSAIPSTPIPGENIILRVRGSDHTYRYELRSIRGDEGGLLGFMIRLTDITRYRQLDAIKSRMVSTVSHELRTPLTSMGMSLELLMEQGNSNGLDPMQAELLVALKEDVIRLQRFAHDLLDISQIESGDAPLKLAPVPPRALVDMAARGMREMTERQEIGIDTTGVPSDLPDVLADGGRINQVFRNLYENAIRYTPFRGTIAVSAKRDGDHIQFCVQDNGPGITEEEAPHIFEKFYQGKDSQRAGGSGLGLAIVREIIEAHGGSVRVESAVGKGSSFYFSLRLAG